jgi:hypothetical protein
MVLSLVGLLGNTASLILSFIAFILTYTPLTFFITAPTAITIAFLNYLVSSFILFIALGIGKKGRFLGRSCIISGVENWIMAALLISIFLTKVVQAPLLIIPIISGYGLIQNGKRALLSEDI